MAFLGLIPAIIGAISAAFAKKKKDKTVNLDTPTSASTSVLLSQQRERRRSQNRASRASTNVTGGLYGMPTLSAPALWGVA